MATPVKVNDEVQSEVSSGTPKSRWEEPHHYDAVGVAVKEQRRVAASKGIMVFVLMTVAAALSSATYLVFKKHEEDNFNSTFEKYVSEIIAISQQNLETSFLAIEAFSNSITTTVKASGQIWPNVTIQDYSSQATRMATLAGEGKIIFMPFVKFEDRLGFEEYARGVVHAQIQDNLDFRGIKINASELVGIHDQIVQYHFFNKTFTIEPYEGPDVQAEYMLNWQNSQFPYDEQIFVLNNLLRVPTFAGSAIHANITKKPKLGFFDSVNGVTGQVLQPVFDDIYLDEEDDRRVVKGFVWMQFDWVGYFTNILPHHANGTRLVLESSCGFAATYEINGLNADFIGLGNIHDSQYDDWEIAAMDFVKVADIDNLPSDLCSDKLSLHLYPTDTLKENTSSNEPILYSIAVASIFIVTSLVFLIYDLAVGSRQRKVMARVMTQDKIVSSLFPPTIRDRLYGVGDRMHGGGLDGQSMSSGVSSRDITDFSGGKQTSVYGAKPIADLFLETTVLFADISGFTAWSSAREPSQVFILLENLYGAFDRLCHRHGVFKVETIGDCYVAVTGLPHPNKDHAAAMAKFARDCMAKMVIVTSKMEIDLGPDTGDLGIRIGLHSGQVTAGVLRGERSRFQLFGDTVNVAARMESTGERGKIHISGVTADILKSQGRGKWVIPRGEISVRGKGTMFTYWLETKAESDARHAALVTLQAQERLREQVKASEELDGSEATSDDDDEDSQVGIMMSKKERLVEWNVEVLSSLLKRILAARAKRSKPLFRAEVELAKGKTVLEEFEEIITLPKMTMEELNRRKDPDSIKLDDKVTNQLRSLLSEVASLYRDNPFHSFEHASHVTASVAKLLSRIVTSDTTMQTHGPHDLEPTDLAGHSYGITSDPLTQFTVVFSAIIHDADHPGVPNAQLMRENDAMVSKYKGKSMAEQNSVDLVWEILLRPEYADLRACIYCDEEELKRFRQLLVNVVMATDIADKELGALRKARWEKAFDTEQALFEPVDLVINRKATIVLEHLIQASDVSHTMQHWQVYKKWNQKFFNECYSAWKAGRADTDPSLGWYEGEIGFFNYYIIPLAKKLDSCGVFGVSSHEYLNYAMSNLEEWKRTGQEVVKDFIREYKP